jgi:hypothetical protein
MPAAGAFVMSPGGGAGLFGDPAQAVSAPKTTMPDNAVAKPMRFNLLEIRIMIDNLAIACEARMANGSRGRAYTEDLDRRSLALQPGIPRR